MDNEILMTILLVVGCLTTHSASAQNTRGQDGWDQPFALPVRVEARAQTLPSFAGGNTAAESGEEKSFRILTVKHIPARGVAYIFKDAEVISTTVFIMPAGGGNQGGFGGGFGGGNQGGFGGRMGGFGGGGFGGGGFGGGGFGGNRGGNRGFGF